MVASLAGTGERTLAHAIGLVDRAARLAAGEKCMVSSEDCADGDVLIFITETEEGVHGQAT